MSKSGEPTEEEIEKARLEQIEALETARAAQPLDALKEATNHVRQSLRLLEPLLASNAGGLAMAKVYLNEAAELIEQEHRDRIAAKDTQGGAK